jgi:uracil-DNA glycosylase
MKSQVTLSTPLHAQIAALPKDWYELLRPYLESAACKALCDYLDQTQASGECIYPAQVFYALHLTAVASVKVVILGQDPYHGVERLNGIAQAHGLAFSVPEQVRCPPSLRNIFRELQQDLGIPKPTHGCLSSWAAQGVLLLNTSLTVAAQRPASHARLLNGNGWERFTTSLLEGLAAYHAHHQHRLVVLLWGSHAHAKAPLFAAHDVLLAAHPSPLSAHRGFLGCRHFSRANQLLSAAGQAPIDWRLPEIGVSEQ